MEIQINCLGYFVKKLLEEFIEYFLYKYQKNRREN